MPFAPSPWCGSWCGTRSASRRSPTSSRPFPRCSSSPEASSHARSIATATSPRCAIAPAGCSCRCGCSPPSPSARWPSPTGHAFATTHVPWRNLVWWIVPLNDPHGSQWEAGWMSSPLWYLRALLWMIIASPVLLWAIRRAPTRTLLALATGVFLIDLAARHPGWPLQTTHTPWLVGDFFLYAFFLCLGFLHRVTGCSRNAIADGGRDRGSPRAPRAPRG